ncbi:hypothetical protein OIDMADRAFT_146370 [Oidiodendron maius Zn]|uniref:Uncharacterized protein n=1 Tax=Oidiodendron maius (strain Zn) TaxID=913774 RepID=A0A0C3HBQ0_OIDMZ|nr:hypothetical protein OIDMADRAFT_146370 [Oidiodendron maius Zn]
MAEKYNYTSNVIADPDEKAKKVEEPFPPASVLKIGAEGTTPPRLEKISHASELETHLILDSDDVNQGETIVILNGIQVEYICVVLKALDIDLAFIDAHLCRQKYVPPFSCRRGTTQPQFYHVDFPQVEKVLVPSRHRLSPLGHLSFRPSAFPKGYVRPELRGGRNVRVVETRSALLILDLDIRQLDYGHGIQIPAHFPSVFEGCLSGLGNPAASIPRLHDISSSYKEAVLQEMQSLRSSTDIPELLHAIAAHEWDHLISLLNTTGVLKQELRLLGLVERSLRSNILTTKPSRDQAATDADAHWFSILDHITPRWNHYHALIANRALRELSDPKISRQLDRLLATVATSEGRRALDRVSYMGAILLPFSIVAGLFSMAPDFGPGGRWFFVFWAVSVPIVAVTVILIYADIIRKRLIIVRDDNDSDFDFDNEIEVKPYPSFRWVRFPLEPAWSLGLKQLWGPELEELEVSGGEEESQDAASKRSTKLQWTMKIILKVVTLAVGVIVNISLLGLPSLITLFVLRLRSHNRMHTSSSADTVSSNSSTEEEAQEIVDNEPGPSPNQPLPHTPSFQETHQIEELRIERPPKKEELGWVRALGTLFGVKQNFVEDEKYVISD